MDNHQVYNNKVVSLKHWPMLKPRKKLTHFTLSLLIRNASMTRLNEE